jgi:hypothetical protein
VTNRRPSRLGPPPPTPAARTRVVRRRRPRREADDPAIHVFTASAALVGVCLTVIGLFQVIAQLRGLGSLGDDLLSLDALLFLGACILAYLALRTPRGRSRREVFERYADLLFLIALVLMAVACSLLTYRLV